MTDTGDDFFGRKHILLFGDCKRTIRENVSIKNLQVFSYNGWI